MYLIGKRKKPIYAMFIFTSCQESEGSVKEKAQNLNHYDIFNAQEALPICIKQECNSTRDWK